MPHRSTSDAQRLMGWVSLVAGVLVLGFWTLYFAAPSGFGHQSGLLSAFESAFPLADGIFAATLFVASISLLKQKSIGTFFLVAAASMSLYLGILDVTFYGQQGLYYPPSTAGVVELLINVLCIGGGVLGLRFGWLLWRTR